MQNLRSTLKIKNFLKHYRKLYPIFSKCFGMNSDTSKEIYVDLPQYKTIELDIKRLPSRAKTNKEELMNMFELMTTMRHMELQCNKLYMEQQIRGFLHIYVGEESVAVGIEAGITKEDCVITGYRDHGIALARGDSAYKIIAENISKKTGSMHGKGGSMHFFSKMHNFYGGHGIVGAQISLGSGLGFALKYKNIPNASIVMFGDGAANQGQWYEVANMSSLWKLPVIYLIENNHYGMGTSEQMAHSYLPIMGKFRGFPAIYCDGSNVFAVKEAIKFCKEYTIKNGPIILEIDTYRYYGHGPSDPGNTYRKAEEVKERRAKKDCIEFLKKLLVQHEICSADELQKKDKEISQMMKDYVEKARTDPYPSKEELLTDVLVDKNQPYIRACEYKDSIFNEHKI